MITKQKLISQLEESTNIKFQILSISGSHYCGQNSFIKQLQKLSTEDLQSLPLSRCILLIGGWNFESKYYDCIKPDEISEDVISRLIKIKTDDIAPTIISKLTDIAVEYIKAKPLTQNEKLQQMVAIDDKKQRAEITANKIKQLSKINKR